MPDPRTELAPCDMRAEPTTNPPGHRPHRVYLFARVVLLVYLAFLFYLALVGRRQQPAFSFDELLRPRQWIAGIVLAGVLAAVRFLLLGFLTAFSIAHAALPHRWWSSLGRWLSVLLLGEGLFLLLCLAQWGHVPPVAASLPALAGYLVGAWIGFTCQKGRRAIFWLVPKLGLLLLILAGCVPVLAVLAMDDDPLPFPPLKTTAAEKRRLAEALDDARPIGDGFRQLRLDQRDVNLLLTMAMAHTFPQGKGRIMLDRGAVRGDLSLAITGSPRQVRYLNVHLACRAGMTDGRLEIGLRRCRVGRLGLPRWLLDALSPRLISAILDDPDLEHLVAAIDSVRVEPDGVEAIFRSGELDDEVIPSLIARLGQKPDVLTRTRIHFRHLVRAAEDLPGDDRFGAFLQTAFQLARKRSRFEDPVLENRAAILALAILLGHRRVESLVGPVTDKDLRSAARRRVGRVALRGRRDWSRHFLVSAALALLSNESLSDEVGLFKEEIDSAEGGSGFSFSDLAADRAGTLFALAATRNGWAARRMQDRLAAEFDVDEFFPPAADLPEGIPDPQLQADYGGVGGMKYNQVIREIERRLAACRALE